MRYAVSVSARGTLTVRHARATAAAGTRAVTAPKFATCPGTSKSAPKSGNCPIGALRANKTLRLVVAAQIRTAAKAASQVTVIVAVTAPGLSQAEASVTAVVGPGTPSPGASSPSSLPSTPVPATTLSPLPGTTVTPNNLSGLFPVVTPGPKSSRAATHRHPARATRFTTTAAGQPIGARLIGPQLVGLVALAVAITLAVARLSLRRATPRAATRQDPPADQGPDPDRRS
ncbi:MAG: cupin domain-containing protein [Streptosporangiaceae bacterium]